MDSQVRFRSNIDHITKSKLASKNVSQLCAGKFDMAKASNMAASAAKSATSNSVASEKSAEVSKRTSGTTTRQHYYFNNTNCKSSKFLKSKALGMENNSSESHVISCRKESLESQRSKSNLRSSGHNIGIISSKKLQQQQITSGRRELLNSSNQITQKPNQDGIQKSYERQELSRVCEIDQKPSMLVDER